MNAYHQPVMLMEAVDGLNIQPDGIYVDVTYGGGGHSKEILIRLNDGKLIGFDQDPDAESNKIPDERFTLIRQNFKNLKKFLRLEKAIPVQGILADLGISSHQIDTPERGFSTRYKGGLDMRMDKGSSISAKEVINDYPEEKLADIFHFYGEIPNARALAKGIVNARRTHPVSGTDQLKDLIIPFVRGKRPKYLAKVFQAIRIEVNGEIDALKELLEQSAEVLEKGGRMVVISYHSLEDRLAKNYFKRGSFEGEMVKDFYGNPLKPFRELKSKPFIPSTAEIELNPRARSAKMRIAEKI